MGYREILQASLAEKQKINHRYSMRTFAKKIGIEASTLSQILRGRRELPVADAQKVISRLQLSDEQQKEFLNSMDSKSLQGRHYENYLATPSPLGNSQDQMVQNFLEKNLYSAVLVLMDTTSFRPDTAWMAQRLKTSTTEIDKAWTELQQLGLIENQNGTFVKKYVELKTSDEIQSASLKKAHNAELALAQEALQTVALTERDFTSMTFAVDMQQMKQAKVLIRSFLKQMEELLENKKSDEVFQLNVQLFPLTEIQKTQENS